MTGNEYQELAFRTAKVMSAEEMLADGVMGLCGEAGECCDIVKKVRYQGHELNRAHLIEELGDVCWYIALCCSALEVDMDEVLAGNIAKLKRRYPEGFSEERSVRRDE